MLFQNEIQFPSSWNHTFNRSVIFPTKLTSFLDLRIPIPRDPDALLKADYGPNYLTECQTYFYDHRREAAYDETATVACKDLKEFVRAMRERRNNSMTESRNLSSGGNGFGGEKVLIIILYLAVLALIETL